MSRKPTIAVIGDARVEPGSSTEIFAEKLGRLIIDSGWRLQTGGMGGIMEAVSRGARESERWSGGDIIAVLPGFDPADANPYSDIVVATGLGHGRNMLVVQADAVVAIGGGPGTLSEIAFAWLLNKLIVAMRGSGWSGKLADTALDERRTRLPQITDDKIYGASTPDEAVTIIKALSPLYAAKYSCGPQPVDSTLPSVSQVLPMNSQKT